jgi:two-component system nitrogen regulation response regulator GlnG
MASLSAQSILRVSDWQEGLPTINQATETDGGGWQDLLKQEACRMLQSGRSQVHAELKTAFEQSLMEAALQLSNGRRQQAAQLLGLGRNTLTRKLGAKHGPKDNS